MDIIIGDYLSDISEPAVISTWFFNSGDKVESGIVIAEVMVQKASYEIEAEQAGVLYVLLPEDSEVTVGTKIGEIVSE